jgi:hypothetical protein
MDKLENLALVAQMLESAEKNMQSARQLLREILGTPNSSPKVHTVADTSTMTAALSGTSGGKVIEGVFDGQNMVGPDGKQYPVPANYASKSKLIEGDILKLTIAEDGSFIYKQIGPAERKKMMGILVQDDRGDFRVLAEGKPYRVLLASLTYFKAEPGDQVTIVTPQDIDSVWAAVELVIKKDQAGAVTPQSFEAIPEGSSAEEVEGDFESEGADHNGSEQDDSDTNS